MFVNVSSDGVPSLAGRRIATPEMLDVAQRNVVAARKWPRTIVATAGQESFATKLSKATKALAARKPQTRQQHAEQSERERNRYTYKRRERTKGE